MDVSINLSNHSFEWQNQAEIEPLKKVHEIAQSVQSENHFSVQDKLQVRVQPGGLTDTEIMEYFEKNQNHGLQKQRLEDLKNQLTDNDQFDRSTFVRLHNLSDSEKEAEIRQMLHELEQARDLEKIIFGESNDSNDTHTINQIVNHEIKFEIQGETIELEKRNLQVDLTNKEFSIRREADPLVLDLGDDGVQTTGIDDGVRFDLNGDKAIEQSSFVKGNDYALALDKNQNGQIDSGRELFGDQNGAKDGIEELKKYDENKDGKIDKNDSIFFSLMLVNSDRMPKSLIQAGVDSIDLERIRESGFTSSGDRIKDGLKVNMTNGSTRNAFDVYFQYRN